ncbi:MAG TPA: ATP-binding protein [Candidatus Acidoferrales bacterium]|nr:ATP-binding protein [Candidatus Acidoferrales bacterium]
MKPDLFDYAVIVAATMGTLVYLFLMILIVGYRRRRTFERVLFFLALAAFLAYSGVLLGVNAKLFYSSVPVFARDIVLALVVPAAFFLPALLLHAHAAYIDALGLRPFKWSVRPLAIACYSTPPLFVAFSFLFRGFEPPPSLYPDMWPAYEEPAAFQDALGWALVGIALFAIIVCSWVQLRLAAASARSANAAPARFHRLFSLSFALLGLTALVAMGIDTWPAALLLAAVLPGALLIVGIIRYRLLDLGMQKNLVYGVTAGFLAILYLALVRRVSGWAEPYFPPEATSAVLIFVLIGFFEPLQRFANRVLRRNVEQQLEQLQRLTNELQREARDGDLRKFLNTAQERIQKEFGLESVQFTLTDNTAGGQQDVVLERRPAWAGQPVRFALGKKGAEAGEMIAVPIGSSISGEAHAALEFLAEQLPGIIELCRAVEEKSRLERELAERERLALVGQMTASISHNLKNPLGSMKTVLQVQLENPRLDGNIRRDLQMVLSELDRLSAKLNALLRYSRPAVRGTEAAKQIEVARVAEEVVALMKSEAERRDVSVQIQRPSSCGCISGSEEALSDIFSNLIVNAIEAVQAKGRVDVRLSGTDSEIEIAVGNDGPGIPVEQQAQLFQPFFTTKASGTGLGLAIVRRRAMELGGTVSCTSPIADGRGAEFTVKLPRMKC